jgi:uncharacterized protein (TIGR02145 family)
MNKTRGLIFTASLVLAITFTLSCEDKEDKNKFTDSRDGKTYKKVVIGSQTWMAENLNYEAEGSKCYKDKPENCDKYGRLYNWETAMKACPSGWHLPSEDEYGVLVNAVGGKEVAGKKLKSSSGWKDDGNGTDEFGFSALPGGSGDDHSDDIAKGNWWGASEAKLFVFDDEDKFIIRAYSYEMGYNYDEASSGYEDKYMPFSIRCIQD